MRPIISAMMSSTSLTDERRQNNGMADGISRGGCVARFVGEARRHGEAATRASEASKSCFAAARDQEAEIICYYENNDKALL